MKTMKTMLCVLLVLILAGCGEKEPAMNPYAGIWEGETASMGGMEVAVSELFEAGIQLDLQGGGKGRLIVDGDKYSIQWACEDGVLTVEDPSLTMTGSITPQELKLSNLMGTGIDITFSREGGTEAGEESSRKVLATVPAEASAHSDLQEKWNGTWYGCAYIAEVTGDFADIATGDYDVYMIVELDSAGTGTFEVRMAGTDTNLASGSCRGSEQMLTVTDGLIADVMPINTDNWTFLPMPDYPDQYVVGDVIEDEYGSMAINFFMKQWGRSWEKEIASQFAVVPPGVEEYEKMIAAGEEPPIGFAPPGYAGQTESRNEAPEETEAPVETQAPAETEAQGLRPGEPTSDGDGVCATEEDFLRLYKWLKDMDFNYKLENATYEYVRDYAGVDGEDQGPNEEAFRAFKWYPPNDTRRALYVSFSLQDNGKWVTKTMNTQNFSYDDIPESIVVTYDYE